MEIRAREAEELFAAGFGIGAEHRVAFRRRIEHLRSYGCPTGLDTGRGRAAMYGWLQLVQQVLALELVDLGIPPERAAALVVSEPSLSSLAAFQLVSIDKWIDGAASFIDRDTWPFERTIVLVARLSLLQLLRGPAAAIDETMDIVPAADLHRWVRDRRSTQRSAVMIDFGMVVSSLIKRLSVWLNQPTRQTAKSFREWAECYDINP